MMLLASWPLNEFGKFLQLIIWIIVPILLLAVLLTLLLHYRKAKRKKSGEKERDDSWWFDSPENIPGNNSKGAHILLDHSGVIRQYQEKLSYYNARYAALKQDFRKLESKYTATHDENPSSPIHFIKNNRMENTITFNATTTDQLAIVHQFENETLPDRLEQLNISHKRLDAENNSLREQLLLTREEAEKELATVRNEVNRQDYVIEQLRIDLMEKENQLIYLHSLVRETKHQNELQQAELADNQDQVLALQEQLTMEESRVVRAMQKLENNQQMLKEFHRTISDYFGTEDETHVIELKPVYTSNDTEGWN